MQMLNKTLNTFLISIISFLFFSSFNIYNSTAKRDDINWQSSLKLKQSDFKAKKRWSQNSSVANTFCGFGYSITDNNGNIEGSIFVKFYGNNSWFNPKIHEQVKIDYILKHEQLHFDICELFGRKLYKEVLTLISLNSLNQHNIDKIQSVLKKQYSNYQKEYDRETDHSINVAEQLRWENKVKNELTKLSSYSGYKEF